MPLVCIDAGHQRKGDNTTEPVAPGSNVYKARVSHGTTGVATKKPEYQLTLEVSLLLQQRLLEAGYPVLMIRETHDVNISNSERAAICNDGHASVALRIHADGSELPQAKGITVLYPGSGALSQPSKALAAVLLEELLKTTGAKSRGVVPRDDLAGFNYSQVPSILLEMGFMTNAEEDRLMSTPEYQAQLVAGMVEFVKRALPLP
ncbi:N-acetylmuramoyl-L-alanine amidase [Paenibacillus koleovorans]|uniref:N-acetylmuramoyl-L-alanine amidase n=1 Tax=Paenibacillus koleovorans TaxID=121608 RepID=UPI000FDAED59|nr:N-acetylmuramoyl-L-alanine amidase [Paenibacillus koleovorans]